ncbi:MAG: hypothetical protein H6R40_633, partial [Gemmatimonadetes bacterium]|nr:hypothetical protein [Gemmatimonadota bacterium]
MAWSTFRSMGRRIVLFCMLSAASTGAAQGQGPKPDPEKSAGRPNRGHPVPSPEMRAVE